MMNYNVSGSRSSGGSSYQYLRAYTETGVNIADWILRSRQDYYSQGGRSTFTQGDTYAQHAVPSVRSTFQAGQISPAGSLFSVGTLRGAQLFPEQALRQTLASGVNFSGIATGQSRIEVRQLGRLILMTQVPAGAFTINDVPIVSGNSDLEVQVIAASGERQQFVVPAASFGNVRNVARKGCPPRWGVTRPRAAVTAGRRWSPPSATAGAWAAAAPSTPAFWCPPVPRTGRRGFSQPQRCAQRFDRRARPAPASRARSSRASRSRRTCRPRRSSACPRACRPPCRRKAIATWRRWCRRRARMPGSCPARARPTPPACPGSPRPWAPFPQPIPPAACPARKASATARRCPGTGASPAPRSACPWPRISARARGRDRKTSIS